MLSALTAQKHKAGIETNRGVNLRMGEAVKQDIIRHHIVESVRNDDDSRQMR